MFGNGKSYGQCWRTYVCFLSSARLSGSSGRSVQKNNEEFAENSSEFLRFSWMIYHYLFNCLDDGFAAGVLGFVTGALVVGGVAAIAASASKKNKKNRHHRD